jgi:hypothetical protein
MSSLITENKRQLIANILYNARLSTNDEIIFYLHSKTKIQKELLTKIVFNERPHCMKDGQYEIDFNKYLA